ncbi:serine protease [Accumulibacter sp.]|uniref:SDH family Clp fold serine proteinase n=1 Tax=Accumulibacter sp. TaxID=2053492 RepID=UPI002590591C|nr:serine protease [Accumulibacter sp.]MCM8580411.1 serine protease [Accumulibacter sp.]
MYAERKRLYKKIEAFTESKVLCFVTGDRQNLEIQIAPDALDHFTEHLDRIGVTKRIALVVYSRGGNTLAGWSIVNLIKQFCDEFQVIIPYKAHSTATLIALGASSIMMTKQATLGPIDPSVNGPLNPQMPGPNIMARVPVSVESVSGYLEFAKSVGIQSESEVGKLVLDLASRINPLVLGNVYRSRSQIRMLGKRLLAGHMTDQSKIDKILDFLCSESGSHDYTINRREAANELGLTITKPDDVKYKVINALHQDYTRELELQTPFDPNVVLGAEQEREYSFTRGLIESIPGGSTKFISRGKLRRTQIPVGPGQIQDAAEDRRTFEAWKHD